MPYAELHGARIHYTDSGGDGAAIVFSHGLLFSGAMFQAQIDHFRDRYRCIAFDHRGQGKSAVTKDGYDMKTLTADAAALIRHLNIAPCHFVGLSMGGFVGIRLAAQSPDLLSSMTLLDSSAGPEPKENGLKYRFLNLIARWFGLRLVVGRVMPIMFGQTFLTDPARDQEKRRWANVIAGNHRIGITRAVTGVVGRRACDDLLDRIDMPVGIGVGDEDVATVPDRSRQMQAAIRGSEMVIFKGAGHSSSIETPLLVNDLIQRTITRQEGLNVQT